MTRREFDLEFSSVEDCLVAAFDQGLVLIAQALTTAVHGESRWLPRVRLGLRALLKFLDSEPHWARVLVLDLPEGGGAMRERRQRALATLARLLDADSPRLEAEERLAIPRELLAELVVGGVLSVVQARMLKDDGSSLLEIAPPLMSLVALPYLGSEQAGAELAEPSLPRPRSYAYASLGGVRTRTTHRTMLVLRAIAASPHSSNRDVAAAAGVSDEGQTSRLLARLQREGLIENVGLGQAYGEPNAWLLTKSGEHLAECGTRELLAGSAASATRGHAGRAACQNGIA